MCTALVYAFVVGKVARATLLDIRTRRLLPAFRWSFQKPRQQNSSDSERLQCYRSYGSSTTVPPGAYSVGCLDAEASNDRSSSLCNAPLKRIALDQLFLVYRLPRVSEYANRLIAVRESFGNANDLKNCSSLGRGSYTLRQRMHCSATPILHVSQWMAWSCSAPAKTGRGYSACL